MHSQLYGYTNRLTTNDLTIFIKTEFSRIGADQNITPREVIRDFIELSDLLYQNPEQQLQDLLQSGDFEFAKSDAVSDTVESQDFAEFEV